MANVDNKYPCPVCDYGMSEPPESCNICPCCGTEFEVDDFDRSPQELRMDWINAGLRWFSRATLPPKDWNPYRQLIAARHRLDLVASPRFETDVDYQYAVDEAFSSVRMARKIRSSREAQNPPMTQAELAEQADMKQSRISELESIDYPSASISTLRRLAKPLGLRFVYGFEPLTTLGPEIEEFNRGISRAEREREVTPQEQTILTSVGVAKESSLGVVPAPIATEPRGAVAGQPYQQQTIYAAAGS